ncbi:MAG: hypothetical protein QOF77_1782 [Solirubrobacteraceae bacterium]|nr:hypothetical protein [Solirubrobacteraceae bacterium]
MDQRAYTAEEVDAAVQRLADPGRLAHASEVVTHAAPSLAAVLDAALAEGGWFGPAHDDQVRRAAEGGGLVERCQAVERLVVEQTRVGMLVGVAVGFQLSRELEGGDPGPADGDAR